MCVKLVVNSLVALVALGALACDAPGTTPGAQAPASCTNGTRDPDELEVDCGGPCAACQTEPSRCDDGLVDGGESDVDCGGACPPCGGFEACRAPGDCLSRQCGDGVCAPPATCDDGARGDGESDVDCGGPCRACATSRFCEDDADCLSRVCVNGVCRDESCSDARLNQDESDVDCGGGCVPCDDGLRCGATGDCASGQCADGRCLSCDDGVHNGDESGVDCGGGCAPCGEGVVCSDGGDCASGRCEAGVCCVVNACGGCGPIPDEVCDGEDDDCDGATDEDLGAPPACDMDEGVCRGARATCRGAGGWTCDEATYRAVSGAYEGIESRCDGLDNDCDGQTDEGLLNGCGVCGPVGGEACNGVDDDCDGQTDEGVRNACGACAPEPIERCDGVDDDCDGLTDESAECAACGTSLTLDVVAEGTYGAVVTRDAIVPARDGRVLVASSHARDGESVYEVVAIRGDTITPFASGSGGGVHIEALGDDLLLVAQADGWRATRMGLDGAIVDTWEALPVPASAWPERLVVEGDVAALVVATSNDPSVPNSSVHTEVRLAGGLWSARPIVGSFQRESGSVLVGGELMHLYATADTGGFEVRLQWGAGASRLIAAGESNASGLAVDDDGRVHVLYGSVPRHASLADAAGPVVVSPASNNPYSAPVGMAIDHLGRPLVVNAVGQNVYVFRLVGERWSESTLATRVPRIDGASFALDAHGRVIVVVASGAGGGSLGSTSVEHLVFCPR